MCRPCSSLWRSRQLRPLAAVDLMAAWQVCWQQLAVHVSKLAASRSGWGAHPSAICGGVGLQHCAVCTLHTVHIHVCAREVLVLLVLQAKPPSLGGFGMLASLQ